MNARAFCHNCGADIERDEPITFDEFSMNGDGWPLCYHGKPVKLTRGECGICWSLMKAYPDMVTTPTLLDRIDSEGGGNIVTVMVCRVRHKLHDIGARDPIETVWGRGYRWKARADDTLDTSTFDADIHKALEQLGRVG